MTSNPLDGAVTRESTRSNYAAVQAAAVPSASDEPTLDQLFADPIVRQLMRRDKIDEDTTRRLLQRASAAGAPPRQRFSRSAPVAEDDQNTIAWLLRGTARLWCKRYDQEIRAQIPGMTCARCAVLIHLAQHEGVNQVVLAQHLGIKPITLARLLDRLETEGFIARMPDPHDRRAHVLALTAKARPTIERIHDLAMKIRGEAQLGISEAEASQLRALLCRIRSNLTARRGEASSAEPARGGQTRSYR